VARATREVLGSVGCRSQTGGQIPVHRYGAGLQQVHGLVGRHRPFAVRRGSPDGNIGERPFGNQPPRSDAWGPYHQLALLADRQISGNVALRERRTRSLAYASGWDGYGQPVHPPITTRRVSEGWLSTPSPRQASARDSLLPYDPTGRADDDLPD
jgi:hypothetical protein